MRSLIAIRSVLKNEIAYEDPAWFSSLTSLMCSSCGTMLPRFLSKDPGAVITTDPSRPGLSGMLIPIRRGPFALVHNDLNAILQLASQGFGVFPVSVDGVASREYSVFSSPFQVRMTMTTSHAKWSRYCGECGRQLLLSRVDDIESVVAHSVQSPAMKDRTVFSDQFGSVVYLAKALSDQIPDRVAKMLNFSERPLM